AIALISMTALEQGTPAFAAETPAGATTLVLFNDVPKSSTTPDLGPGVATVSVHNAVLRSSKGKPVGTIHVVKTSVLESAGVEIEKRMRNVVFYLGDGQIVASGMGLYPKTEQYFATSVPQRIAIVGGTGKYLGARGEVTTTRSADGTYRHVLTLLK
ncbi:MAG: hypothetical protein WCO90_12220, partial [Planctomycetota bacterium]